MDEDVAVWERGFVVVGVRDANDANFVQVGIGLGDWQRGIQQSSEEKKRRRLESFKDRWRTSIQQCVHGR